MTEGEWKELQRLLDKEAESHKGNATLWLIFNGLANVADEMAKFAQE